MKVFKASSQAVEVNGNVVHSVLNGMGEFKDEALKILANCGIENVESGRWYNQQSWLNAFKEISEKVDTETLNSVGERIEEYASFPPEIDDIHKALLSIDIVYHMTHRKGTIGNYKYDKLSDSKVKITCTGPYPDEFDKGIITAMANRFKPSKVKNIDVKVDSAQQTRTDGGCSTTFIVSW